MNSLVLLKHSPAGISPGHLPPHKRIAAAYPVPSNVRLLAALWLGFVVLTPLAQAGIADGGFEKGGPGWNATPSTPAQAGPAAEPGAAPGLSGADANGKGTMVARIGARGGKPGVPKCTLWQEFTCGAGNLNSCGISFNANFLPKGAESAMVFVEGLVNGGGSKKGKIPAGMGKYTIALANLCNQKVRISFYIDPPPGANANAPINSLLEIDNAEDACLARPIDSPNWSPEDTPDHRSPGSSAPLPRSTGLRIQPQPGGGVYLSWPATETSFILEETTDPRWLHWTPVTHLPSLVDGKFVMSEPMRVGMRFYRLSMTSAGTQDAFMDLSSIPFGPIPQGSVYTVTLRDPLNPLNLLGQVPLQFPSGNWQIDPNGHLSGIGVLELGDDPSIRDLGWKKLVADFTAVDPSAPGEGDMAAFDSVQRLVGQSVITFTPGQFGSYNLSVAAPGTQAIDHVWFRATVPVSFSSHGFTLSLARSTGDNQAPCQNGTLLVRQVYSECNADGFWHVVEDDWYACPPDNHVSKFRVWDTPTPQPCGPGQAAPNAAVGPYPICNQNCQSPVAIGSVVMMECVGGMWSESTYLLRQCANGNLCLDGPISNLPAQPATPCTQPPPKPSVVP